MNIYDYGAMIAASVAAALFVVAFVGLIIETPGAFRAAREIYLLWRANVNAHHEE